jgi:cob(I)alamin adenosyltransferase
LLTHIKNGAESHFIEDIQQDLYVIMGFLANAPTDLKKQKNNITLFEKRIDALTEKLLPLTHFIIPRGSPSSCWAHMARVNCRRAERTIIIFFEKEKRMKNEDSQIVLKYLNRLSDLLFTYARVFNNKQETISNK